MSEDCDKAAEAGVDEDMSTLVWWPEDIKCYKLTSNGPAEHHWSAAGVQQLVDGRICGIHEEVFLQGGCMNDN